VRPYSVISSSSAVLTHSPSFRRAINNYDPNKLIAATTTANASATLFITAPATQVGNTVEGFCQGTYFLPFLLVSSLLLTQFLLQRSSLVLS
jgi:hypothetical protein